MEELAVAKLNLRTRYISLIQQVYICHCYLGAATLTDRKTEIRKVKLSNSLHIKMTRCICS